MNYVVTGLQILIIVIISSLSYKMGQDSADSCSDRVDKILSSYAVTIANYESLIEIYAEHVKRGKYITCMEEDEGGIINE